MADIAASVLARLNNKAKETGRSNQLCMQLFCQEEFLRRLQQSRYADNLILKGGLFIYALTEFDSRITVDIDFLLQNVPNTVEDLRTILDKIITINTGNDYISFEITKIEPTRGAIKHVGLSAIIVASIKKTRTTFGIDFGFGDVIVPKQEKRNIPTQLDGFIEPEVNAYSVETVVAEKLDAILSLMEYSSRMKDYYDILYISKRFNFEGKTLCKAIVKTLANRERDYSSEQVDQLLSLGSDTVMKKKWAAFLKRIDGDESDFNIVLYEIGVFLRDIVIAAISDKAFERVWNAESGRWT